MTNRKATKDNPHGGRGDEYERDLERDNRQQAGTTEPSPRSGRPETDDRDRNPAAEQFEAAGGTYNDQKDRTGQAQSPRELNLNQPPKRKEGH